MLDDQRFQLVEFRIRGFEVAMTIWSAAASPCRRAARLGVLPTASFDWSPTPAASPTTTGPVAMPMRTDKSSVDEAR
jgi:hypothetical protein